MTSAARTLCIKDAGLDTVERRVFIRRGLPKTFADPNQIQHIHHTIAIDIGIKDVRTISRLSKGSSKPERGLGYSPRRLG